MAWQQGEYTEDPQIIYFKTVNVMICEVYLNEAIKKIFEPQSVTIFQRVSLSYPNLFYTW